MANTNPEKILDIGKGIYLRKPVKLDNSKDYTKNPSEDYLATTTVAGPKIILIFSWMGAALPHLLKYSKVYSQIYPEATQVLIRSEPSFFFSSQTTRKANLEPLVEVLELLGVLPPSLEKSKRMKYADISPIIRYPSPSILVHAFSNGGSWQLATLSEMLASRAKVSDSPSAMVLDSCPGNGGVNGTIRAFSSAIRSPILRALISLFIRFLYFWDLVARATCAMFPGYKSLSMIDKMKACLNREYLLPWLSKKTPRLYLYCTRDAMIPDSEVEAHAADAQAQGFQVCLEKFDDTAHVAHAKVHPDRYWMAIRKLWEDVSNSRTTAS